jgi:phosphoribosylaminoimidazole-succinocarboxamide synthase
MSLALPHLYSGKVRDLYAVGEDHLLLVASDRLSAFDVVMNEPIANKGRVLTGLTNFWVHELRSVPTALVSCDPVVIDELVPGFGDEGDWHGRAMLVRRAQMLPLECIVRGRLAGQAYDEYRQTGTVHGMDAPVGLRLTDPFPEPLFTPSTKAASGHDINIDLATAAAIIGPDLLDRAAALCLDLFDQAQTRLRERGLILADTKFELGFVDGELVVCDEVLTPDSSRLWPADRVISGETPPSFDKQPFRDWLSSLDWDRTPPPPRVPQDIVGVTAGRYEEAYERITGRPITTWFGRTSDGDDETLSS